MDKRIGKFTTDKIEWPETTISGISPYRKPCTMVQFGDGFFAVLDTFIQTEQANVLIAECQALVDKSKAKPKAAKAHEEEGKP